MLIRAIVENQIKMLNTAAKQSPGTDVCTFMLITREERKKIERIEGTRRRGCRSAKSACEGDGESKLRLRVIK